MCLWKRKWGHTREIRHKIGSDKVGLEKSSTPVLRFVLALFIISHYYTESSGLPNLPMYILESSGDLQQIPKPRPHPKDSENETRIQSWWSSSGLGSADIKYRNQINPSSHLFETDSRHHSREFKKGIKKGRKGGRNKGTNTKPMHSSFYIYIYKKIICTYTHCCPWS